MTQGWLSLEKARDLRSLLLGVREFKPAPFLKERCARSPKKLARNKSLPLHIHFFLMMAFKTGSTSRCLSSALRIALRAAASPLEIA